MQTDRGEVLSVSVDRDDGPRELRRRLEAALGAASLAGASLSFGDQEIPLDQASPGALGRGAGAWGAGKNPLARGEVALRLPTATPLLLRTSSPGLQRSRSAPDLLALLGAGGAAADPSFFSDGDEDADGGGGSPGPGSVGGDAAAAAGGGGSSAWLQARSAPRGLLNGRRQRSQTAVVWGARGGRGGLAGAGLGTGGAPSSSSGGEESAGSSSASLASPAAPVVEVMGGPRARAQAQRLRRTVRQGLQAGHCPLALNQGLGGSYVFKGPAGESAAVAKPSDEEPLAPNNPKGFVGRALGDPGLKPTVRVGEAGLREVAASLLDHGGFSRVPLTALAHVQHPVFHVESTGLAGRPTSWRGAPTKLVSLQEFVEHDSDAGDCGASGFPVEEVHRIGILDVRLFNTDRHSGNILIRQKKPAQPGRASSPGGGGGGGGGEGGEGASPRRRSAELIREKAAPLGAQRNASFACFTEAAAGAGGGLGGAGSGATSARDIIHPAAGAAGAGPRGGRLGESCVELVPIDHGFCLPETLEAAYFEWLHWPQSSMPFSEDSLDYIAGLDPRKDSKLLRQELPTLRTECLRVLEVSTTLLQRAAVAGLCLAEIGMLMSRPLVGLHEEPSELERMCLEARDATVASGALQGALRSSCLASLGVSPSDASPGAVSAGAASPGAGARGALGRGPGGGGGPSGGPSRCPSPASTTGRTACPPWSRTRCSTWRTSPRTSRPWAWASRGARGWIWRRPGARSSAPGPPWSARAPEISPPRPGASAASPPGTRRQSVPWWATTSRARRTTWARAQRPRPGAWRCPTCSATAAGRSRSGATTPPWASPWPSRSWRPPRDTSPTRGWATSRGWGSGAPPRRLSRRAACRRSRRRPTSRGCASPPRSRPGTSSPGGTPRAGRPS